MPCGMRRTAGFTLIELLVALVVLSILGIMSYRGLSAVLDTREHVRAEADKWRKADSFFARFARDVRLAAPRPVRTESGTAAAWLGRPASSSETQLEFSRFAANENTETARRVGYRLNGREQVELWMWPGLDVAPSVSPVRYAVLENVKEFELQYLDARLTWTNAWPIAPVDSTIPLAVRMRVVLGSGEELVRIFALKS